jgi:hypothetical protein
MRHLTQLTALSAVALAAIVTQAHAQITFNSTPFISAAELNTIYGNGNSSPIGITYTGTSFVGTGGYDITSPQLYQTNLSGGSISTFGSPLPIAGGEVVLSASPSGSGFGSNYIYSGSGANGQIYQYTSSGGTPSLFATVPNGDIRGINFDTTGLYGDNMIVTTTSGDVYEVTSAGAVSLLADTGQDTEGIAFATEQFGTYAAGTLFTTSEGNGDVDAILPNGTVSTVFTVTEAESISFVPANVATDTDPSDGYYAVNYPNDIEFAPISQFDQYAGDVIVTSETGSGADMTAVSLNPTTNAVVTYESIGSFGNQPEDSIFVTDTTVETHGGGGVPDGGNTAAMLLAGILLLGALSQRRKLALSTRTSA